MVLTLLPVTPGIVPTAEASNLPVTIGVHRAGVMNGVRWQTVEDQPNFTISSADRADLRALNLGVYGVWTMTTSHGAANSHDNSIRVIRIDVSAESLVVTGHATGIAPGGNTHTRVNAAQSADAVNARLMTRDSDGSFWVTWGAVPTGYTQVPGNVYEFAPPIILEGTATISGDNLIGSALTVNTGNITGGEGAFSFYWKADDLHVGGDSNTYTITRADAGKTITCVVSRADAEGSVTATLGGGVVPYNITIEDNSDKTGNTPVTLSAATGRAGEVITLEYILGNSATNNALHFTGATGISNVTATGAGTQDYTVYSGDADEGEIAIIATFIHTDKGIQDIYFEQSHIDKILGVDTTFTQTVSGTEGGGAVTYTSSHEYVATVDNNGVVTIVGAGDNGTITGVTTTMEYRLSTAVTYTPVTRTTITNLAPGTYLVRFAATTNLNASADTSVTIEAFSIPFTAVTNIIGVPTTTTAGITLNLIGTVATSNATNQMGAAK
jgi:hypothetical protein